MSDLERDPQRWAVRRRNGGVDANDALLEATIQDYKTWREVIPAERLAEMQERFVQLADEMDAAADLDALDVHRRITPYDARAWADMLRAMASHETSQGPTDAAQ